MEKKKSTDIWYILTIIPGIIIGSSITKGYFTNDDTSFINSVLLSAVGGGLGGGLGALVWVIIKNKTLLIKIIITCFFIVSLFYGFTLAAKYNNQLLTCDICGYIAVTRSEQECDQCMDETYESINDEGDYESKEEWVKEGQLIEFSIEDSAEYNFYYPDTREGYLKDKNWKPSITYQDILEEDSSD